MSDQQMIIISSVHVGDWKTVQICCTSAQEERTKRTLDAARMSNVGRGYEQKQTATKMTMRNTEAHNSINIKQNCASVRSMIILK